MLAFLALVTVGLLGGLHATEFRILTDQATPVMQGRYLLPLLPLFGLAPRPRSPCCRARAARPRPAC